MSLERNIVLDMDRVKRYTINLLRDRIYVLVVSMTAFFCYGYMIFHGSIGADDMTLELYFVDGLAPQIGRNTIYLLNKIFRMSDFSPVIIDFLGVFFMSVAATLLCAVFEECTHEGIKNWMCAIFTCTMLSFSLISEVYIYYLHNGIGIGYLFTVIALIILLGNRGGGLVRLLGGSGCLTLAITCYESFAIVFLLIYFCIQWFVLEDNVNINLKQYTINAGEMLGVPLVMALIGRRLLTRMIHRFPLEDYEPRGLKAGKWILEGNLFENVKEILEGTILNYGINSVVICSLRIFNVLLLLFLLLLLFKSIKTRNFVFFVNGIGAILVPWLFLIIEGRVTAYRQMQALNVLEGFMLLCLCLVVYQKKILAGKWLILIGAGAIIYNQSYEQNYLYYVDYLRYSEDTIKMNGIMMELSKNYSLETPICFVADEDKISSGIIKNYYYCGQDTPEFIKMNELAQKLGIELETDEWGYCPYQTLALDVSVWATGAWNSNMAMKEFYAMHGYNIVLGTEEMLDEAKVLGESMNSWPEENSINDMGTYIIVKL